MISPKQAGFFNNTHVVLNLSGPQDTQISFQEMLQSWYSWIEAPDLNHCPIENYKQQIFPPKSCAVQRPEK